MSLFRLRSCTLKDFEKVSELDRQVYPTESPVKPVQMQSWVVNNEEFGLAYEDCETGELAGICVIIPLNRKGWEELCAGSVLESGVEKQHLFDRKKDTELFIHVYHLSKLKNVFKGPFADQALRDTYQAIQRINQENSVNIRVEGSSALAASTAGIHLFYNRFNFRETGLVDMEHVFTKKSGEMKIVTVENQETLQQTLDEGYQLSHRCKMLVLQKSDPSVFWSLMSGK